MRFLNFLVVIFFLVYFVKGSLIKAFNQALENNDIETVKSIFKDIGPDGRLDAEPTPKSKSRHDRDYLYHLNRPNTLENSPSTELSSPVSRKLPFFNFFRQNSIQSSATDESPLSSPSHSILTGSSKKSLLHAVVERGRIRILKSLLEERANVDCRDEFNRTLLHISCEFNQVEMVQMLLDALANPELRDSLGKTPIHIAAKSSIAQILIDLVSSRVDLDVSDDSEMTSLHLASASNIDPNQKIDILVKGLVNTEA